jgi:hypothetical protein
MSVARIQFFSLRAFVCAVLLCSWLVARAGAPTTYAFSYRFADGVVVSGSFSGTPNGNLITNLSRVSAFIDGSPLPRKVSNYGWVYNGQTFSTISGTAVASFDGTQNALLFSDSDNLNFLPGAGATFFALAPYFGGSTDTAWVRSEFFSEVEGAGVYGTPAPYDASRWSLKVVPTDAIVVNGTTLTGSTDQWVRFVAAHVVRQLPGTRSEQIQTAALSTWWALKEGILSVKNPVGFSSCSQLKQNGSYKDVRLKVTETCATGRPWQVGISGIQVPNVSDAAVFSTLATYWPHLTLNALESEALGAADTSVSSKDGQAVLASTGDLQKSWLLRFPALGVLMQAPMVKAECVDGSRSWCYGTGWPQSKSFAPDKSAAMRSIQDLVTTFAQLSP